MSSKKSPLEKKLAVLIIDMQELCTRFLKEPDKKSLINSQLELIDYYKNKDIPIVITEYKLTEEQKSRHSKITSEMQNTIKEINEAVQNIPRLKYIHKFENDAFSNGELNEQLLSWKSKYLLLTGIFADLGDCVQSTAETAINLGFKILTAGTLIKESFSLAEYWYKQSGIYFDDHKNLLKYISKAN